MSSTQATTSTVTSKDGSTLAVDTFGDRPGPPVVLIGGAFNDRSTVKALAEELAPHIRVVTYDRRGRVDSSDKSTEFEVQNEIDDVAAVIEAAGGRAFLFGHSSGAILALEATIRGLPVDRVAVYEPPYRGDPDLPYPPIEVLEGIKALVAAGDRNGAAEYFLGRILGVPEQGVVGMRHGKGWDFLADKALTLPYDVLLARPWEMADLDRLGRIAVPVLAMYGDETWPMLMAGTKAVAAGVAGTELVVVPGEDHGVLAHPGAIAPDMLRFFGTGAGAGADSATGDGA